MAMWMTLPLTVTTGSSPFIIIIIIVVVEARMIIVEVFVGVAKLWMAGRVNMSLVE